VALFMSQESYVIAVDLGGTNLRIASVRQDGTIENKEKLSSEARLGSEAVLKRVAQGVKVLAEKIRAKKGKIQGVSLGFPGIVDPAKGIVYQSPHFPDWKNLELLPFFKTEFPWPVVVDNDANLAALGESWKGAGKDLENFVMLTFGTGVGGGIIIDKKVFHGDRGFAGEVGHSVVDGHGPRCACGSRGCLEMYISATGILRLVEIADDKEGLARLLNHLGCSLERLTVRHLYEAALDGDIFAHGTFKKMGYYLGIGLASLVNTLGIETFVLGGGVSEAWDFFIHAAKKELSERTYRETASHVILKKAELGDDAALVGGAAKLGGFSRGMALSQQPLA